MNQTQSTKIAFIQASWHADLVQQTHAGFLAEIEKQGLSASDVESFAVPGSLELPLQAQRLARTGRYALIVCAGLVVDGGIYRHEFVAQTVLDGLMRVQLDTDIPVLSIVLTPHEFRDSEAHREFFHSHLYTKGQEAASACLQMLGGSKPVPRVAEVGAGHA